MNDSYSTARKKPTEFNSLSDAIAWNQARTEERRAQRKREREADPETEKIRRIRREMYDKQKAEDVAKEAEAAKHARVGCPPGFNAHVDRDYHTKLSFLPYLERALRDYEKDHPDQAPVPLIDVETAAMERREAESLARAREFFNPGADKAKLLAAQPAYVGDEEFKARHAARHALRQEAADPLGDHEPLVGEDTTAPTPAPVEAEPPKRGRGRPPKFMQRIEVTDDGAIIED